VKRSPAVSPASSLARRLHLVHLGDTSNRIWQTSFDGLALLVRLGLKVLVEPDRFSFHTMLYEMATVYATADFRVVELDREDLEISTSRSSMSVTAGARSVRETARPQTRRRSSPIAMASAPPMSRPTSSTRP